MKKINWIAFLILAHVLSARAQDVVVMPKDMTDTLLSLETGVLQDNQVADIMNGDEVDLKKIQSDLRTHHEKNQAPEGIPQAGLDAGSLVNGAYRAVGLIKEVLAERMEYELGPRVPFMLERIPEILAASGRREDEMLLRFTLNRCQDMVAHLLPVSGHNYDEIGRWAANFIKQHFELAAAYGNNRYVVNSIFAERRTLSGVQAMESADFGRIYATLLWESSIGLNSDTAKAVTLMKLLSFLGWDLNNDLRRREDRIAQSIRDVYRAQHGPEYKRVFDLLRRGREPRGEVLAALRSKVERVRANLNQRLLGENKK